jgi:hypothetical protein
MDDPGGDHRWLNTAERDRPWLAEGISRATWYRRRAAQ